MTYCVGLRLDRGLVFASDTRTSAGVDNVATFSKMHVWERQGDRVLVLLSAGNLSVTQSVVSLLNECVDHGADPSLLTVSTLFQAARLVGDAIREVRRIDDESVKANPQIFAASFIFGVQIAGDLPRLFMVYQEGNFVEATADTPYFQIGEHKYGKPIIDRAYRFDEIVEAHRYVDTGRKRGSVIVRVNGGAGQLPDSLRLQRFDHAAKRRARGGVRHGELHAGAGPPSDAGPLVRAPPRPGGGGDGGGGEPPDVADASGR